MDSYYLVADIGGTKSELGAAEDLTRAIINLAGQKGTTGGIAVEVLQLFASILGAAAHLFNKR